MVGSNVLLVSFGLLACATPSRELPRGAQALEAVVVDAQQPAPPPTAPAAPRGPREPAQPRTQAPPATPGAGPEPRIIDPRPLSRRPPVRDVNVQIDLTISDQTGSAAADKKTVSLIVADQTSGRVRANANARRGDLGMVGTVLNVDAEPVLLDNDRILLGLTIEYAPLRDTQVTQQPTVLNERLNVILQNGKPLTISQAADPISDRRITVEVKATIIK